MSIGLTVLGLVPPRLLWRLSHPPPPMPAVYGPWERRADFASYQLDISRMFAALALVTATGLVLHALMSARQQALLGGWHESAMREER